MHLVDPERGMSEAEGEADVAQHVTSYAATESEKRDMKQLCALFEPGMMMVRCARCWRRSLCCAVLCCADACASVAAAAFASIRLCWACW